MKRAVWNSNNASKQEVLRKHHRNVSVRGQLTSRQSAIKIHKGPKVTNVSCLSSQRATRQLKMSNKFWWNNGVWYTISRCWKQILQNLRSSLTKRENLFKTCSLEQKYNLKAVTRRDHESHIGSPCRSIFTFILMSRRRDLSLVSTFLVSLLSILLRRKTYF